mgnify:CR=1 FL=1
MIETVLSGAVGIGLGISAGSVATLLLNRLNTTIKKPKPEGLPLAVRQFLEGDKRIEDLPPWLQKWLAGVLNNLQKSGVKISPIRYIIFVLFGAVCGFVLGITIFQNLTAAILISASVYLIPDQLIRRRLQGIKFHKIEQLGAAVKVFAAEYADTPQVPRALKTTSRRTPEPLGAIFREADRMYMAGNNPDKICEYLIKELDFEYGKMFVQLLRVAWGDASAKPLFGRLAARIAGIQSLIMKNKSGLAYSKNMAIIINALAIPAAIGIYFLIPETMEFFVTQPTGRLLVCAVFLNILIGLILDKILNEVEA